MLNFKSNITYYLSSTPTDMRKSREGLAGVVRETMQRDPYTYGDAFIFYSKDLKKVKILHYDINGRCHRISRELLILLLSTSVQTRITINDEDEQET